MKTFTNWIKENKKIIESVEHQMDPKDIKTEKPMSLAGSKTQILMHHMAGKMPLDKKKVQAMEKVIKSGRKLPPLVIKGGILQDGHHRLQAHRNVGSPHVTVVHED